MYKNCANARTDTADSATEHCWDCYDQRSVFPATESGESCLRMHPAFHLWKAYHGSKPSYISLYLPLTYPLFSLSFFPLLCSPLHNVSDADVLVLAVATCAWLHALPSIRSTPGMALPLSLGHAYISTQLQVWPERKARWYRGRWTSRYQNSLWKQCFAVNNWLLTFTEHIATGGNCNMWLISCTPQLPPPLSIYSLMT